MNDLSVSPGSAMAWRSCAVLLRLTGEAGLRGSARGGRWPHSFQQRCGFRKAARKPESKKVEEELGPPHTESSEAVVPRRPPAPHVDHQAPPRSSRGFGRLFRPLVFTVGFTGCSFGSAAIWQYESLKSRVQSYFDEIRADWLEKVRPQKRGDFRKEINRWWQSLSEGQKVVTGIIAANALVFCCWRVPSLQRSMIKYFTANPTSKTLCSPMLLSTFSHFSLFHMAANMYVLWSFSTSAVSMLGREQFMAVYLSAGVISTFVSYVCKTATGRFGPSLGASGAIMTVLAAVCTKMPEAKLAIIFLPMFTFTASNALSAIIAMDTAGLVLGWKFFDHAAHLGGALFGMCSRFVQTFSSMAVCLQVVGLVLGVVSWCLQSSCTSSQVWKMRSQAESVTTSQWQFEGLWMSCAATSLGSIQCSRFKTVLGLPAHLQACRALMILSLIVGLASIIVSVLGLKCTKIGRTSDHVKDQIALSGGILFILSGAFTLIAVSWYAARVIHDFYNPLYGGVRFEMGTGLYLGWAASCLAILGGSMLCCSCRKTSSPPARQFSYNFSTTSRGQNIYRAAPASDSSTSKAYV